MAHFEGNWAVGYMQGIEIDGVKKMDFNTFSTPAPFPKGNTSWFWKVEILLFLFGPTILCLFAWPCITHCTVLKA